MTQRLHVSVCLHHYCLFFINNYIVIWKVTLTFVSVFLLKQPVSPQDKPSPARIRSSGNGSVCPSVPLSPSGDVERTAVRCENRRVPATPISGDLLRWKQAHTQHTPLHAHTQSWQEQNSEAMSMEYIDKCAFCIGCAKNSIRQKYVYLYRH